MSTNLHPSRPSVVLPAVQIYRLITGTGEGFMQYIYRRCCTSGLITFWIVRVVSCIVNKVEGIYLAFILIWSDTIKYDLF